MRRLARSHTLAGVMTAIMVALGSQGVAATAAALRPDLRMAVPKDVQLCGEPVTGDDCPAPTADSPRLLRFTSTIVNVGQGPLIVRATRNCPDCWRMSTVQVIRRTDGTRRTVASAAKERYSGNDHHNHWHLIGLQTAALYGAYEPLSSPLPAVHKSGYCFFDGPSYDLALPGAPSTPRFGEESCGDRDSQALRTGLSVGWGDIYPWNYEGQAIRVTALPPGDYLLCLKADAQGHFIEGRELNNRAWARLTLTTTSVVVNSTGTSDCQTQVPYAIPS